MTSVLKALSNMLSIEKMEVNRTQTRNLIVAFVWIFVLVISVASFWDGKEYIAGGPYGASLLVFIMAIIASAALMECKK